MKNGNKLHLEWIPNAYANVKEQANIKTVTAGKTIAPVVRSAGLYQYKKRFGKKLQG